MTKFSVKKNISCLRVLFSKNFVEKNSCHQHFCSTMIQQFFFDLRSCQTMFYLKQQIPTPPQIFELTSITYLSKSIIIIESFLYFTFIDLSKAIKVFNFVFCFKAYSYNKYVIIICKSNLNNYLQQLIVKIRRLLRQSSKITKNV